MKFDKPKNDLSHLAGKPRSDAQLEKMQFANSLSNAALLPGDEDLSEDVGKGEIKVVGLIGQKITLEDGTVLEVTAIDPRKTLTLRSSKDGKETGTFTVDEENGLVFSSTETWVYSYGWNYLGTSTPEDTDIAITLRDGSFRLNVGSEVNARVNFTTHLESDKQVPNENDKSGSIQSVNAANQENTRLQVVNEIQPSKEDMELEKNSNIENVTNKKVLAAIDEIRKSKKLKLPEELSALTELENFFTTNENRATAGLAISGAAIGAIIEIVIGGGSMGIPTLLSAMGGTVGGIAYSIYKLFKSVIKKGRLEQAAKNILASSNRAAFAFTPIKDIKDAELIILGNSGVYLDRKPDADVVINATEQVKNAAIRFSVRTFELDSLNSQEIKKTLADFGFQNVRRDPDDGDIFEISFNELATAHQALLDSLSDDEISTYKLGEKTAQSPLLPADQQDVTVSDKSSSITAANEAAEFETISEDKIAPIEPAIGSISNEVNAANELLTNQLNSPKLVQKSSLPIISAWAEKPYLSSVPAPSSETAFATRPAAINKLEPVREEDKIKIGDITLNIEKLGEGKSTVLFSQGDKTQRLMAEAIYISHNGISAGLKPDSIAVIEAGTIKNITGNEIEILTPKTGFERMRHWPDQLILTDAIRYKKQQSYDYDLRAHKAFYEFDADHFIKVKGLTSKEEIGGYEKEIAEALKKQNFILPANILDKLMPSNIPEGIIELADEAYKYSKSFTLNVPKSKNGNILYYGRAVYEDGRFTIQYELYQNDTFKALGNSESERTAKLYKILEEAGFTEIRPGNISSLKTIMAENLPAHLQQDNYFIYKSDKDYLHNNPRKSFDQIPTILSGLTPIENVQIDTPIIKKTSGTLWKTQSKFQLGPHSEIVFSNGNIFSAHQSSEGRYDVTLVENGIRKNIEGIKINSSQYKDINDKLKQWGLNAKWETGNLSVTPNNNYNDDALIRTKKTILSVQPGEQVYLSVGDIINLGGSRFQIVQDSTKTGLHHVTHLQVIKLSDGSSSGPSLIGNNDSGVYYPSPGSGLYIGLKDKSKQGGYDVLARLFVGDTDRMDDVDGKAEMYLGKLPAHIERSNLNNKLPAPLEQSNNELSEKSILQLANNLTSEQPVSTAAALPDRIDLSKSKWNDRPLRLIRTGDYYILHYADKQGEVVTSASGSNLAMNELKDTELGLLIEEDLGLSEIPEFVLLEKTGNKGMAIASSMLALSESLQKRLTTANKEILQSDYVDRITMKGGAVYNLIFDKGRAEYKLDARSFSELPVWKEKGKDFAVAGLIGEVNELGVEREKVTASWENKLKEYSTLSADELPVELIRYSKKPLPGQMRFGDIYLDLEKYTNEQSGDQLRYRVQKKLSNSIIPDGTALKTTLDSYRSLFEKNEAAEIASQLGNANLKAITAEDITGINLYVSESEARNYLQKQREQVFLQNKDVPKDEPAIRQTAPLARQQNSGNTQLLQGLPVNQPVALTPGAVLSDNGNTFIEYAGLSEDGKIVINATINGKAFRAAAGNTVTVFNDRLSADSGNEYRYTEGLRNLIGTFSRRGNGAVFTPLSSNKLQVTEAVKKTGELTLPKQSETTQLQGKLSDSPSVMIKDHAFTLVEKNGRLILHSGGEPLTLKDAQNILRVTDPALLFMQNDLWTGVTEEGALYTTPEDYKAYLQNSGKLRNGGIMSGSSLGGSDEKTKSADDGILYKTMPNGRVIQELPFELPGARSPVNFTLVRDDDGSNYSVHYEGKTLTLDGAIKVFDTWDKMNRDFLVGQGLKDVSEYNSFNEKITPILQAFEHNAEVNVRYVDGRFVMSDDSLLYYARSRNIDLRSPTAQESEKTLWQPKKFIADDLKEEIPFTVYSDFFDYKNSTPLYRFKYDPASGSYNILNPNFITQQPFDKNDIYILIKGLEEARLGLNFKIHLQKTSGRKPEEYYTVSVEADDLARVASEFPAFAEFAVRRTLLSRPQLITKEGDDFNTAQRQFNDDYQSYEMQLDKAQKSAFEATKQKRDSIRLLNQNNEWVTVDAEHFNPFDELFGSADEKEENEFPDTTMRGRADNLPLILKPDLKKEELSSNKQVLISTARHIYRFDDQGPGAKEIALGEYLLGTEARWLKLDAGNNPSPYDASVPQINTYDPINIKRKRLSSNRLTFSGREKHSSQRVLKKLLHCLN